MLKMLNLKFFELIAINYGNSKVFWKCVAFFAPIKSKIVSTSVQNLPNVISAIPNSARGIAPSYFESAICKKTCFLKKKTP